MAFVKTNNNLNLFTSSTGVSSCYYNFAIHSSDDPDLVKKILDIDTEYPYHSPVEIYDKCLNNFDWITVDNPFQRIIHLRNLEDNWDGYGAKKIDNSLIDKCLNFYCQISSFINTRNLDFDKFKPFIAPASNSSVLFEWAGKRFPNKNLEIYVDCYNQLEINCYDLIEDTDKTNLVNITEFNKVQQALIWLIES